MIRIVSLTVALLLFSVACSSGDHSGMDMGDMPMGADMPMGEMDMGTGMNPIPADADFNAADVEFAQGMIVHHGQALQMADLALVNSTTPEVLALASEIKEAQGSEIDQLSQWLTSWGQRVPDPTMGNAMDHGGMPMDGMISAAQMDELMRSRGAEFDRLFLQSMLEHHEGAIAMAAYVLDNGRFAPLAALANDIIAVQEAEIVEIQSLLNQQ